MHQGPTLFLIGGPNGAGKTTFALESTLSGKTYAKYLELAKQNGFRIALHFLWLPHPDESWARVQSRVREGGHAVPKDAVYRRFPRIHTNLLQTYVPLSHHWLLWDASQSPPEIIAEKGTHDIVEFIQ